MDPNPLRERSSGTDIWPSREQMIETFHQRLGYSLEEAEESAASWDETFENARQGQDAEAR